MNDNQPFNRNVLFIPAYAEKDYGIHPMECSMLLSRAKQSVEFLWCSGEYLPESDRPPQASYGVCITYRSDVQPANREMEYKSDCGSGHCEGFYYASSFIDSHNVLPLLISGGSEAVWAALQERFDNYFNLRNDVESSTTSSPTLKH